MRASLCLLIMPLLCNCASVTSQPFERGTAVDGKILYKLPATELVAQSTWKVQSCIPVPDLRLTDLSLSYNAVPDPNPENWFVIDPADLVGLFSSVNPAEFGFSNGMITKVDYSVTSEAGPILKETIALAAKVAARTATGGIAGLRETGLLCSKTLRDKISELEKRQEENENDKKGIGEKREYLEKRLFDHPSTAAKLAVDRADAKILSLDSSAREIEAGWPVLRINAVAAPTYKNDSASNQEAVEFIPELGSYSNWFNDTQLLATRVRISGKITSSNPDDEILTDAPRPGPTFGYYRFPAKFTVVIHGNDPDDAVTRSYVNVPMLHRGRLARLELDNGIFTNSGYTVQFDPAGGLTSYRLTSSSIVKDAVQAIRGASDEADAARLNALQNEVATREAEKKLKTNP